MLDLYLNDKEQFVLKIVGFPTKFTSDSSFLNYRKFPVRLNNNRYTKSNCS